jgi:hypothetical protein
MTARNIVDRGRRRKSDAQITDFTHRKFRWLAQVAADGELPLLAARLCILLCDKYFNLDHGGYAWASQATLAKVLGVCRRSVNGAMGALIERGHLTSKRRGDGQTSLYRLALKEGVEAGFRCAENVTSDLDSDAQKSAFRCAESCAESPLKEGREKPPPRRTASRPPGVRQEVGAGAKNLPVLVDAEFEALQAAWPRPWCDDEAADRAAFAKARELATFEDILTGAKAWVAAADDPRFLQSLAKWLKRQRWKKPPPNKMPPRGNGKVDLTRLALTQECGWTEDADGNLVPERLQ